LECGEDSIFAHPAGTSRGSNPPYMHLVLRHEMKKTIFSDGIVMETLPKQCQHKRLSHDTVVYILYQVLQATNIELSPGCNNSCIIDQLWADMRR